ncbi:ATP-dependent nuclease, partial [Bathymodiolus thermophilus thioautotrophic gill symbiont]
NKYFPYYFPTKVIALYSGEELRLWENYYQEPYLEYNKQSLDSASSLHQLSMLYVNKYYWDIALLTMYASDMGGDIDFLKIVGAELKEFKLEVNIRLLNTFLQQKPNNEVNNFVWELVKPKDWNGSDGSTITKNEFVLNLNDFKSRSDYKTHVELFNLLCIARLPKDSKHKLITSLELIFENGITTKDFSEGQKKQILLKLILDVLADEKSLVLLDEPDAHIHISNKKLIPEMLKKHSNKEVILTTHSPTLAHCFDDKNIAMLGKCKKCNPKIINSDKFRIINDLTNGLWNYQQQGIFLNSKDLVLLVEGSTDKKHIETALEKLKEEYTNLDFDVFSMDGADNIRQFILGVKKSEILHKQKKYIAIFDNDEKGRDCHKKIQGQSNFRSVLLPVREGSIENMYSEARQKESYQEAINSMDNGFNAKNIEQEAKKKLVNVCGTFDNSDFSKFRELFNMIIDF